jgi:hypothetical protein
MPEACGAKQALRFTPITRQSSPIGGPDDVTSEDGRVVFHYGRMFDCSGFRKVVRIEFLIEVELDITRKSQAEARFLAHS